MLRHLAAPVGCAVLLFAIAAVSGPATRSAVLPVFVVAMLGLSWDILSRAGLVSIGQGAVFGLSAYASVVLATKHVPYPVAIAAAVVLAIVFSVLFGYVTLRLQGIYFSLATLAVGVAAPAAILMTPTITNGAIGINAPEIAGGDLLGQAAILAVALILAAIVSEFTLRSRLGPILFTIRDAPRVARTSGIDVTLWRTIAFAISAAIAGLSGAIYGGLLGYVHSDDVLALSWSVLAIAAAVIGGVDSTLGSIVGAAIIVLVNTYLSGVVGGGVGQIVYGALLIALLLFARGGIVGLFVDTLAKLRGSEAITETEV